MPELPEVEVVRRGLAGHVVGATVRRATLSGARVARRHPAGPDDLAARLQGARIARADRRGKFLWLVLEHDDAPRDALVVHLGMSGQLLVQPPDAPPHKHQHATFDLDETHLRFVDQRTFGGMLLVPLVPDPYGGREHPDGIPEVVTHIAPDPLESAFDTERVVEAIRRRRSAVKRSMLDQGLVSGIGNIYADESLWRARIHGERPGPALTRPAVRRLLAAAAEVMGEALQVGGTSFDALYVNVNGASGYFDRSLAAYGQAGRPCPRCGTPIRRESFMNRSSFSCPSCQPRPRVRRG